jgi:hypothetical protein
VWVEEKKVRSLKSWCCTPGFDRISASPNTSF